MSRVPEVKILKTIDEIGRAIDSIADDGFFTYGYFKALEMSKPFDIPPLYLAMYDEGEIVAAIPCYISSESGVSVSENSRPSVRKIMNLGRVFGFNTERLLVCSSPSSYHSEILFEKRHQNKAILKQICKKIDDICREERVSFSSFPYVSECEDFLVHNLLDFGYLKFPSENTLSLDVRWSSFEDYLGSLESHKIRTTVRREIKKCRESGVSIAEEPDFGDFAETLANLHSSLFSKYNKGVESPRNASFFKGLSEYAKDKTRVFVAKRDDRIVGFSLSLQQKDTLDVHLCGFDYDAQLNTDFTYFNVVYYATIKLAIEEGIRRVHYSIKSERVKQKRGCKLEKTYSFIKCHNRLVRPLYKFYTKDKHVG